MEWGEEKQACGVGGVERDEKVGGFWEVELVK